MINLDWYGLYNESWQGEITPEAFAHPAKFSRGLIRQIYRFLLDKGLVKAGDTVVDPFGGVGLGGLDAMLNGLHWRGCELEPRFVALAQANIDLWNGRYAPHFSAWGTAVISRGDSRNLAQVIGAGDCAVSSPPYADSINATTSGIDWEKAGRPDRLKPSPKRHNTMTNGITSYGTSAGQLGGMDAAVSSPPFEAGLAADRVSRQERVNLARQLNVPVQTISAIDMEKIGQRTQEYGSTPGNVGNDTGESFWTAARVIVEQTYAVLKPGAVAAWTCGDFVRRGKRVCFGQQWLDLCATVGFEPYAWAVAWKTEHRGTQLDLTGKAYTSKVDRISFFRRLANASAHARELWGTIPADVQAEYLENIEADLWSEYEEVAAGMNKPQLPTRPTIDDMRTYEYLLARRQSIMAKRKSNKPPTPGKVLDYAQVCAWVDAGQPENSDAAILNEDVIFVRKPVVS
jgi:hypothetical protein